MTVRTSVLVISLFAVFLSVPGSAGAKGFRRAVLVGADGRWVEVHAKESFIERLMTRNPVERISGGYVRLFFVGPGDFPANPGRYYPEAECVALDWPTYGHTCGRLEPTLVLLMRRARSLARFRQRPTVLASVTYRGRLTGPIATADALRSPVELALDRRGRPARPPTGCYAFSGSWHGPAAARRPPRFRLCARGVYANGLLYPLARGVWDWFRINVD